MFVLAKRRSEQLFFVRWRARGAVGSQGDRNVGTLLCPASPRPAVRRAPCRADPPVECPGFALDRCSTSSVCGILHNGTPCCCQSPVKSKSRKNHGQVGSGRPAQRPSRVGQDWVPTELFAQGTKVRHTLPKKKNINASPEARTCEILGSPEERNLSSLKPGHTPGGLVRGGARRDGGAGRGRAAQEADDGTVCRGENKLLTPQTIEE